LPVRPRYAHEGQDFTLSGGWAKTPYKKMSHWIGSFYWKGNFSVYKLINFKVLWAKITLKHSFLD